MASRGLTAALIGAGARGHAAYGAYALKHSDQIRFVAVVEPNDTRRQRFAKAHAIPPERQFQTWEELMGQGKIADVAFVCTVDRIHSEPAIAALEAGYDVFLEKPMATTVSDCIRLVQTAERTGRLLEVGHVLRHTAFFSTLHEIVASGRLGDIVAVEHRENVAYWHMAHSYVRGNWRNSEVESPIILAKCCHDLDIMYWNLGPCKQLNSSGSLIHFRPENAPKGAPERCINGCPVASDCPWNAMHAYLDLLPLMHIARRSPSIPLRLYGTLLLDYPWIVKAACRLIPSLNRLFDYQGWPISTTFDDPSQEGRREALKTGPYGRCVYHCDNNVADYQVVNMEFEQGASGTLILNGHSHDESRSVRYDGTRATLTGEFASYDKRYTLEIHDHLRGRVERIHPEAGDGQHGGGDTGIMNSLFYALQDRSNPASVSAARESLESHLMAFAAEEARHKGNVVCMSEFRRQTISGQYQ